MTSLDVQTDVLPFLLWSRIWSQLGKDEERAEAWDILDLPSSFRREEVGYWNTFHAGLPGPPVSLLFHAALGLDGANVREDWMRASTYLGLEATDNRLPPDHLACACEILAIVLERNEPVLLKELATRYVLPWCAFAEEKLQPEQPTLAEVVRRFSDDLLVVLS